MPSPLGAIGSGLSQGAERFQAEQAEKPFRDERLKQAQLQTQQAQANVDAAPIRQSNAEMQNQLLQQQVRQGQGQQLKSQTFDAFRAYQADGDVRHLNNFYTDAKRNPIGRNMFKNLARVDKLERTAETEKMLTAAGIQDLDGFFGDPELVKSMVISTQADGKKVLTDMDKVYQGTGYTKRMLSENLELMTQQANLKRLMMTGQSHQNVTSRERIAREMAEALGIPVYEAYQKLDRQSSKQSSTLERLTEQVLEENPELTYLEAAEQASGLMRSTEDERRAASQPGDAQDNLAAIKERKARTSAQKNIEGTQAIRDEIREITGGKPMNAADPAQRRELGYKITDLEAITGRSLSNEDKRVARELRNLTNLGATAGELITDAETGPVDYLLKGVKKYISDEVKGTEATSSYEQFRNIFRNALYGASLTKTETDAFTKAAGSLYQQRGPVLSALKTQMTSVRNNIQSIYDTNDPDIAEYYLGMSLDDADKAIEGIDDRLQMMSGVSAPTVIKAEGKPKRSLDDIYSGVGQ